MKRKAFVYIMVWILGATCTACVKGRSTSRSSETRAYMTEAQSTQAETEQRTEPERETGTEYQPPELNTVESLEDDGKELSAEEAIRSVMKGKHSALELYNPPHYRSEGKERIFHLGEEVDDWVTAVEIRDYPDTGLARINMLTYNRVLGDALVNIDEAKWDKFVCVDLDQDGTMEVLVEGGPSGVALHYAGGEVYMTVLGTCIDVYENGVIWDTAGICTYFYYRYYPAKAAMYLEFLTQENRRGENNEFEYYEIKRKRVTQEEHDAYVQELIGGLTPLEWHEFTEANIDQYVR